jgi:hypothetical protein
MFACVSRTSALAQSRRRIIAPQPPIYRVRPIFPVFPRYRFQTFRMPIFSLGLGSGLNSIWWPRCGSFSEWGYNCGVFQIYQPPIYFYGSGYIRRPELAMKDGTIYTVTDYWLVNGQLHFKTMEQGGAAAVEHVIDFSELDTQKTIDLSTQRGFRFVLRNEPIEQHLQDHPTTGAPSNAPPVQPQP